MARHRGAARAVRSMRACFASGAVVLHVSDDGLPWLSVPSVRMTAIRSRPIAMPDGADVRPALPRRWRKQSFRRQDWAPDAPVCGVPRVGRKLTPRCSLRASRWAPFAAMRWIDPEALLRATLEARSRAAETCLEAQEIKAESRRVRTYGHVTEGVAREPSDGGAVHLPLSYRARGHA